jgi:hypothetical protein
MGGVMQLDFTQRWRAGRASYRPAGEVINTRAHEVAELEERDARAFCERHHYEHSYVGGRRCAFGLYRGGDLVGVAAFAQGWGGDAGLGALALPAEACRELKRLVLLDDVPANGESWFVARCFEQLRRGGLEGLVSFSDPEPRVDVDGRRVFAGHLGIVYRALNAVYVGRATPRTRYVLRDGAIFSEESQDKIRNRDKGWRAAAAELERWGATPLGETGDARAWLRLWRGKLTQRHRHRGNLKYLWGLTSTVRRRLPASQRYPTWSDLRAA